MVLKFFCELKELKASHLFSIFRSKGSLEKRILVVIGTLEVGGTEKHIAQIFPQLQKQGGYKVSICALARLGPLKAEFYKSGVTIFGKDRAVMQKLKSDERPSIQMRVKNFFLALGRYLRQVILFYFAVFKFRPDIVHFYLPQSYIIGGVASLFIPKVRRIMSRRSLNDYHEHVTGSKIIESFLHTKMDIVTGNSQAVIDQLIEEGVPQGKLKLIYNGVSVREGSTASTTKRGAAVEIICIANLIPYKGHMELLGALAGLPKDLAWHLTCVGSGSEYEKILMREVAATGIADRVVFTGSVLDPTHYLSRASIAVNCSHQEGFSNAILEYMSFGLAIIATDVGGNAEAIRDEVDGLIVASQNPSALRQALLRLFNEEFRMELGTSARRRAVESFSLKGCLQQYNLMYEDLDGSSSA